MFLPFFEQLRRHRVPATLREFLDFLGIMDAGIATYDVDAFYFLARTSLVKDERHIDRFDQAFAASFAGLEHISTEEVLNAVDLPADWLEKRAEKMLTPEERAEIDALGGFDKLMETLRKRLEDQKGRHQGGSKWVGTAGTSPFGAYGYNPEGVRIGQHESRHRKAVKVWDKREFKNLDEDVEIGTRNIKVALKRLRRWARDGATEELDLPGTIRSTANNGYLDVKTRPERRNAARVLLFLDVGARWTTTSKSCPSSSARRKPSSATSNSSTSTIACTKASGATTAAAGTRRLPRGRSCAHTAPNGAASS